MADLRLDHMTCLQLTLHTLRQKLSDLKNNKSYDKSFYFDILDTVKSLEKEVKTHG